MSLKTRKYKFQEGDSHDIFELELVPDASGDVELVINQSTTSPQRARRFICEMNVIYFGLLYIFLYFLR